MNIAAFNVKQMGKSKVEDEDVLKYLIKIVSRYSVVVLLEVVDQTGRAMKKFLRELNDNTEHQYDMKCSKSVGRNSYKEKFVFIFRLGEVELIDCFQYKEKDDDVLAREPFIVLFKCLNTVVQKLALIPVHTKPEDTEKELDALDDVVQAVRKKWRTDNIMILGDFNASGRYLSKKKKERIRIHSAPYYWLIDDDVDTTSSNSNDYTYDRIVVFGKRMHDAVEPKSAKPFNFQKKFKLTDEETQNISDHYPVEVELKKKNKEEEERTSKKEKRPESGNKGFTMTTSSKTTQTNTSCFTITCIITACLLTVIKVLCRLK